MSELFEKRAKFTRHFPTLINEMIAHGYTPLIGKDGLPHKKNSLHYEGLAVDIDLFRDGVYLTKTSDHKIFGKFWKSLDSDCCWGGDFSRSDGNHYSVTFDKRK